jgi:pimeloyl-ACP methyl ester carboxylesterase
LNDLHLYYEEMGTGVPLLLLHGLGSSGRDWEMQTAFFRTRYRVITVDARGHGRSSKPPGPYSVPQMADDVARLLEAIDAAPAHLVGLSMGGMLGFQLALDRPELLRTLTIVNSAPALVPHSFGQRLQLWQRYALIYLFGMERVGAMLSKRLFPRPEQAELRRLTRERIGANDKRAYLAAMRALVGWSVAHRLEEIDCPTLVVAADRDYTSLAEKEAYVRRLPHAELAVIANAHHAVPMEHPVRFNEIVADFLTRHDSTAD